MSAHPHLELAHAAVGVSWDEPSDDDLLRFLDAALSDEERAALDRRIQASPAAALRLELLTEALRDSGYDVDP